MRDPTQPSRAPGAATMDDMEPTGARLEPSPPHTTTVLLVDDHTTFTDLVRFALEAEPHLACVGAAHDAARARAMVAALHPDVVLMDVDLGRDDGLDLTAEILAGNPSQRVVVLTAHGSPAVTRRAVGAGACAVLPKDGALPDLLRTLRTASAGNVVVHPSLLHRLVADDEPDGDRRPGLALTPREQHVLELLAEGQNVHSISRELHISPNTCRGYVKNVLMKLGAHSQLEAVVLAGMHGLVGAPSRR